MSQASTPGFPPRHILVPVNFTAPCEVQAKWALDLAERWESQVVFIHVMEGVFAHMELMIGLSALKTHDVETWRQALAQWVKNFGFAMEPRIEVKQGEVAEGIIELASELDRPWIVLGRRDQARTGWLGGTVRTLTLRAPCPVLVLPENRGAFCAEFRSILLGTDLSAGCVEAARMAGWLVRQTGERLLVVNVQEPMGLPGQLEYERHQSVIDGMREEAELNLAEWCSRYLQGVELERRVIEGTPGHRLVAKAEQSAVDLLVVGWSENGGLLGEWLGGTASQVVGEAACAVLVVRGTPNPVSPDA